MIPPVRHLGVTKTVTVRIRVVHRRFAAPPPKACNIFEMWRQNRQPEVPCSGTEQARAQHDGNRLMKHSIPSIRDLATGLFRLPRNAARGLIWIYRHTLSPLVGYNCRHLPTCSVYGDEAIARFGLWAGGWMTLARLLRCHPLGTSGIDNVPLTAPSGARWYLPWRYGRWRGVNAPP
jgi:putative membrane protein insertion efficiency factor